MELLVTRDVRMRVHEVIEVPADQLPDWWADSSSEDRWRWIAGQHYEVTDVRDEFIDGTLAAHRVEPMQDARGILYTGDNQPKGA
jgi:hypothetical protein